MALFTKYKSLDGFLKSPKSIEAMLTIRDIVSFYNTIQRQRLKVEKATTHHAGHYLVRNQGSERGIKSHFSDPHGVRKLRRRKIFVQLRV